MADLGMSVHVGQEQLGLSYLDINDHLNYYVAADNFLNGQVSWNRVTTASPFMDGAVTVTRTRQMVQQNIVVEVLGATAAELRTNIDNVVTAFMQDSFYIDANMGTDNRWYYQCEAADYLVRLDGPRMIAHQIQVQFTVPAQPIPLSGVA